MWLEFRNGTSHYGHCIGHLFGYFCFPVDVLREGKNYFLRYWAFYSAKEMKCILSNDQILQNGKFMFRGIVVLIIICIFLRWRTLKKVFCILCQLFKCIIF